MTTTTTATDDLVQTQVRDDPGPAVPPALRDLEHVRLALGEVQGEPVATITLDRPRVLNALSTALLRELGEVVAWLAGDEARSVRAVVIRGAGERAFVAGADITEMAGMTRTEAEALGRLAQGVTTRLELLPVPVVAAVDGYALGGGCELVLACDFAYCTERSVLGQPEVSLGLVAGFGGCVRLQRVVGPARARELLYSGRLVRAREALAYGIVNEVLPDRDALDAAVDGVLAEVVGRSGSAVALTKRAVMAARGRPVEEALELELAAFGDAFETVDAREGTAAFLAHRPARFEGR